MKAKERALFLSLWVVIILVFLLWRFWPAELAPRLQLPPVAVRSELSSWFTSARVIGASPSQYQLELNIVPGFQDGIGAEGREIHLSYHLMGENRELSSGVVSCRILQGPPRIEVTLPNLLRVAARRIELSLAH